MYQPRYTALAGQMLIEGGTVGVDVDNELNPDWPKYAATQKYSFTELRAAFDAGAAHHDGDKDAAFEKFLEDALAEKEKRKVKHARRKKRE